MAGRRASQRRIAELRVSSHLEWRIAGEPGRELFPDEKPSALGGGFLREHRTVVLLRQPVDLLDMGREVYINTDSISFHPVPSEIIVEYLWEDEGVHSERAVFRFNLDFSPLLADT